jgi:hypothetical protein
METEDPADDCDHRTRLLAELDRLRAWRREVCEAWQEWTLGIFDPEPRQDAEGRMSGLLLQGLKEVDVE